MPRKVALEYFTRFLMEMKDLFGSSACIFQTISDKNESSSWEFRQTDLLGMQQKPTTEREIKLREWFVGQSLLLNRISLAQKKIRMFDVSSVLIRCFFTFNASWRATTCTSVFTSRFFNSFCLNSNRSSKARKFY